MAITTLDVIVCIAAISLMQWIHRHNSASSHSKLPHPPGPPGLPLIGNLRDIPQEKAWLTYRKWSDDYGSDIIRLNVFGTNIVVLNSLEVATDLFDKRSTIYNDRAHMTMLYDLIGFGWAMSFQFYSERWRDMRKAFHQEFNPDSVKQFQYIEKKACHDLLRRLANHPESFMEDIRHMAGRIIMRAAYGITVQAENDPWIEIGEDALHALSSATNAGSYLVDSLPFLKYLPEWFPGANFQREAKEWRVPVSGMLNKPFEFVKSRMAEGQAPDCAATSLLEDSGKKAKDPEYMESVIRQTLGSMYAGGADTTVSGLCSFILAMVLYPEVQHKAQQEIDEVVGSGRLPEYSDLPSLPYIEAVVNETLRWQPVLPLDIPHRLQVDDVYRGYFLPKGSIIVGNSWAVLHDERFYVDPSTFNPDRFMKDGKLNPDVRDPSVAAFGFGRRICPGRFMAKDSMWIAIASILAAFKITKVIGEDGKLVEPVIDYAPGLVSYPKPFACDIRPRSKELESLIMTTLSEEV